MIEPARGARGWCGALAGSPRRRPCRPDAARPRRGVDAERFGSSGTSAGETRSHLPSSSGRAPPRRSIRRTSSPPSKRSGRSWRRRFGRARRVGSARAGRVVNRARAYKAPSRFHPHRDRTHHSSGHVTADMWEDHSRSTFPRFRTLSAPGVSSLWRASLAGRVRVRPARASRARARARRGPRVHARPTDAVTPAGGTHPPRCRPSVSEGVTRLRPRGGGGHGPRRPQRLRAWR